MTESFQLTPGSKYHVRSILSREAVLETEGVFKGITTVGASDAIVMEVTSKGPGHGKLRLIPTHVITSLDVIESAQPKEEKAERGREDVHYT